MKTKLHTLENGLRVVMIDTDTFPSVTALLLVGAGSRFENAQNNGIAHFFEHMAFKGTKKYPTAMTIASTIEGFGGVFNAFTSKDYTGYYIKGPSQHFYKMISVLSDMIQHPLLSKTEIEREKGVIVEEINMYEDSPQRKVTEIFENLLYKGNPLGFDIAGTKQTVTSFNQNTFKKYMASLYNPKNAVFVVAGGIDNHQKYLSLIKSALKNWKKGNTAKFIPVIEAQKKPQILIHKKKKYEQAHLCLGWRTFSFLDKRRYSLAVLSAILGKGMSSKLFMDVRERHGLCYYIYTYSDDYADCGNLVTHAGVTLDINKVKKAIGLILKDHAEVKQGKVSSDEIRRAKEIIKGRLILSLEDSFNLGLEYGRQLLQENHIESPEEYMKNIEAVTKKEIVALASEIFRTENLNLAIIGPFENSEEFEKILRI